ncbi:radical SAM protein [Nocardioides sp. YIM B13467]|uniref:radical SAM protein n=1 Tax=Nocardioides sp. YIM B13467 TaxID=3366294 RepID=UPI0036711880
MWRLADMFRRDRGADSPIRFNFVGGEPALLPNIGDLIEFALENLRARVSYVTNGLMLRKFNAERTVQNVDIVGISIDSLRQITNQLIGRATHSDKVLDLADVGIRVQAIRETADRLGVRRPEIKVNTVVSGLNADEDFGAVLETVKPDR